VRPSGRVLHVAQQRLREKTFLAEAACRCPDSSRAVARGPAQRPPGDRHSRRAQAGRLGYDGKGQVRIAAAAEADSAWAAVGRQESVLEAFVDFEREVSVVAARGLDGRVADYG